MRARLLVVLTVFFATWAHADARTEARRHFKSGMALIADGQYDAGIAELQEAYAIKPHPNVLYNIAKAWEARKRVPEALEAWRRYLASNPPDATEAREAVARLENQVQPMSPPEVKPAEPVKPAPEPSATKPAVDAATIEKLASLTDRLERALAQAEARPAPKEQVGAASEAGSSPSGPGGDEQDFGVPYEETVVAAARRAQSTLESASAITVISGEDLRASGATSLVDILRRVPGAEVMVMGASSSNVSFRGFNQRVSNKVVVLIDGRPEYQDFLGVTQFSHLTIGFEDVERIEVIRGPGSALYGANAMLGVINIITRAPGSGPKAEASGFLGNGNVAGGSFAASGGDALKYRVSVGYQQADKYTRDFANDRADVASSFTDANLSLRSVRANATAFYAVNRDINLAISGGVNRLFSELYTIGLLRNFGTDGLSGYAKIDAVLGPLKFKLWWNHYNAVAPPQYEALGQRSQPNTLDSNVFDAEVLFQRAFALGGQHQFSAGLSTRLKRQGWSYIGSLVEEAHFAGFVQDEWKPVKPFTLVGSLRIDRHPLLDRGNPGFALSPRISAVVMPGEGHALRASFATAFRQPTFIESYVDVRVPTPGINGSSVLTQGDRTLRPERLLAFELGYRGEAARAGFSWDLTGYFNIVSDLMTISALTPSKAPETFDPFTQTYLLGRSTFINDPLTYNAFGGEFGLNWGFIKGLDVRGTLAVQQVTATTEAAVCGRCTEAPAAKFSLGFTYRSPIKLDVSADLAFVSATTWVEREPSVSDPTQIANISNPLAAHTVINARVAYRVFNDKVSLAISGTQLGPNHQEHPFGNSLSRRIMGQLTVTP